MPGHCISTNVLTATHSLRRACRCLVRRGSVESLTDNLFSSDFFFLLSFLLRMGTFLDSYEMGYQYYLD